jgi:DNA-binding FadR family transcriptional regulator
MIINESLYDLTPIDTSTLADKVETNLIDYFIRRELKPGDRIPKEIELAEMMGVSRTVIRESLTRLKTMGLIESVKKKGMVLKSPNIASTIKKSIIPSILNIETLRDMFEMRLVIEVGMADFVVSRSTAEDINELKNIVVNEPTKSANILFDIEYEIKFHGKLYEITGNSTLKDFQQMLIPVFNYVYTSNLITKPLSTGHFISHKELVSIIETRDANRFRRP